MSTDTILFLLVIAVAVLFPVFIVGLVFFVVKRNQKNVESWEEIAREIGFQKPQPGKLKMEGNYNGFQTTVAVGSRARYDGERQRREFFTYCVTRFPKPLRFGLEISSPRGFLSDPSKGKSVKIGHESYDSKFISVCYDTKILKRLLTTEFDSKRTANLKGDLMLARSSFTRISLTDEKVYIETPGQVGDHEALKHLLMMTNRLALRFSHARELFPPTDWEKALTSNWSTYAQKHGMSLDTENVVLQGKYRGYPMQARVYAEPGEWKTEVILRFPQPLQIGLNVFPEHKMHSIGKLFGYQDLKTKHNAFDNEFIVKAKNSQVALLKMTPEFCDQILGLKRNSESVSFDDKEMKLTTNFVLGDLNVLSKFLGGMIKAMEKLR